WEIGNVANQIPQCVSAHSEFHVEVAELAGELLRLLVDFRYLSVARTFSQLFDPLVDRFLLAFDGGIDGAVAIVRDPPLESQPPRHACGEEAVPDALHFPMDPD